MALIGNSAGDTAKADLPSTFSPVPPSSPQKTAGSSSSPWGSKKTSETLYPAVTIVDGVTSVELPADILENSTPLWSSFVVGHFIGESSPHIGQIHAAVNRLWKSPDNPAKIDVQFISPRSVLFRIENDVMRSRVIQRNFWHIADVPLVVQKWSPASASSKPDLSSIPIWVDIHGIPDNLFSTKVLSFLGDQIGKFEKLHPNTEKCVRLDVARILVIVNIENPLPEQIKFLGTEISLQVSYPWLPTNCISCGKWGHSSRSCTMVKTNVLIPPIKILRNETHKDKVVPPAVATLPESQVTAPPLVPGTVSKNIELEDANADDELETEVGDLASLQRKGDLSDEGWLKVQKGGRCSPLKTPEKQSGSTITDGATDVSPSSFFHVLAVEETNIVEKEEGKLDDDSSSEDQSPKQKSPIKYLADVQAGGTKENKDKKKKNTKKPAITSHILQQKNKKASSMRR